MQPIESPERAVGIFRPVVAVFVSLLDLFPVRFYRDCVAGEAHIEVLIHFLGNSFKIPEIVLNNVIKCCLISIDHFAEAIGCGN